MAKRLSNFFRGFLSQVRGEWRQMSCSHSEARASPPGNVFASKHGPNVRSNHRTSNLHNPFKKNEKIRITRVFAGFCPILIFGHDFVSNHSSYFFQINSQHQGPPLRHVMHRGPRKPEARSRTVKIEIWFKGKCFG